MYLLDLFSKFFASLLVFKYEGFGCVFLHATSGCVTVRFIITVGALLIRLLKN
jgi:hypothetical protein